MEGNSLFEIRFNEEGKKFIRKFVSISYVILVLVFFESFISIFWSVRLLVTTVPPTGEYPEFGPTLYDKVYPYFSIVSSLMAVVSNIYYIRFPRVLLRSIELNDEHGANSAFRVLFKGAMIFLLWLILNTAIMMWSMVVH